QRSVHVRHLGFLYTGVLRARMDAWSCGEGRWAVLRPSRARRYPPAARAAGTEAKTFYPPVP
ncbi:MAG: hypothetical protein U1E05_25470, partial [Patescibacteria group bacterium]|nr:hypothetical protein [Patescibacteria group bacterium]